jgi:hypothetical protein
MKLRGKGFVITACLGIQKLLPYMMGRFLDSRLNLE